MRSAGSRAGRRTGRGSSSGPSTVRAGPAVWGPRAQCDKTAYSRHVRRVVEGIRGVSLVEAEVEGVLVADGRVAGVRLAGGGELRARAVILTTGTFLGGVLHTGEDRRPGGRLGERPSTGLGRDLENLGLELRRFKTGTPPRLARASLDLERLEVQTGDDDPTPVFVAHAGGAKPLRVLGDADARPRPRRSSAPTSTVLRCLRAPSRAWGRDTVPRLKTRWCGFLTTRPTPCSWSLRNWMERASTSTVSPPACLRTFRSRWYDPSRVSSGRSSCGYGYAVEYDVVAPRQVAANLECKEAPGLFLAGQLLGTSGYEEAAALGLMAGINAVLGHRGEEPWVPRREDAYIGVLVDDLWGREHREPYRMFTSRAEHRLLLGVDSARERLMERGCRLGLVPERVFHVERERWDRRRRAGVALTEARLNPDAETRSAIREVAGVDITSPTTWAQILRRQDVAVDRVAEQLPQFEGLTPAERRVVVGLLRYDGYLARQERERERVRRLGHIPIPPRFDPHTVPGLSREVAESLARERPRTLADAERLPGMTPAAVAIVAGWLATAGKDQ